MIMQQWFVPLVRNHEVNCSNPTPVRFESNVSALFGTID